MPSIAPTRRRWPWRRPPAPTTSSPIRASWRPSGRNLPPLGDVDRAAFLSQYSDEDCEALGTVTKGENVRNEAGGWLVKVDQVLRGPDGASVVYPPERLRFFVECYFDLDRALERQQAAQGKALERKNAVDDALDPAVAAEEELYEALDAVAGNRPVERRALDTAAVPGKLPEERAARLRKLAALGRRWRRSKDPQLAALVRTARLSEAHLQAAERAAATLSSARTSARGARLNPRDEPPVNRAEGRVLVEMRYVMKRFDAAHRRNPSVPRLVPGPATRKAIIGRSRAAAKKPGTDGPVDAVVAVDAAAKPTPAADGGKAVARKTGARKTRSTRGRAKPR